MNLKCFSRFYIRSRTNKNELAKQYFNVCGTNMDNAALIIRKLIYTNQDFHYFDNNEYKLLRNFKNFRLYETKFSIKLNTLNEVMKIISKINTYNIWNN